MCFSGRCIIFQHIQVNRPLLMFKNAGKQVIGSSFQYKLYMGHIHTLVLTEELIARPQPWPMRKYSVLYATMNLPQ